MGTQESCASRHKGSQGPLFPLGTIGHAVNPQYRYCIRVNSQVARTNVSRSASTRAWSCHNCGAGAKLPRDSGPHPHSEWLSGSLVKELCARCYEETGVAYNAWCQPIQYGMHIPIARLSQTASSPHAPSSTPTVLSHSTQSLTDGPPPDPGSSARL